jgi:hypothetical protein
MNQQSQTSTFRTPANRLRLPEGISMTLPQGATAVHPQSEFVLNPEFGYTFGHHPDFTQEQQQRLEQLVRRFHGAMAFKMEDITGYNGTLAAEFKIDLTTDEPIFERARQKSPLERQVANEKCEALHAAGFIERAEIPPKYASETTRPAQKDAQGNVKRRFCGDYREINKNTEADRYKMPRADDLFRMAAQGKVYI